MTTHAHKRPKLTSKRGVAKLIVMRSTIGAETPAGRTISSIAEQHENMKTWKREPWVVDERQTLPYMLKKSLDRLAG